MKDILMLYHRLPFPPDKGEKTRGYQQVSFLANRHRLWVASFIDDENDYQHVPALARLCHRFEAVPFSKRVALSKGALNLLRGRTLTEGYFGHRAMWRVINAWIEQRYFDVALAFSSSMGAYIEDLPVGRRVLDMVDFDSHKWSDYAGKTGWPVSALFRAEAGRLAVRELEMIRRCDLTFVVNEREGARIKDAALQAKLSSFPTLMDLGHYAGVRGIHRDKVVGYVGTLNYPPNVEAVLWFAGRVWPEVTALHPDAQFWIVGRKPAREIRQLHGRDGITVTGAVDDTRRYLARMRVFVAPMLTDIGIPSKVLEALAAGRAVVTTTQGHRGVNGENLRDYLVADDPQDFAQTVSDLLNDHDRCETLGTRAVEFMRQHYDVPARMPEFEKMLIGADAVAEKMAS